MPELLGNGPNVSYHEMLTQVEVGQILVATYQEGEGRKSKVEVVIDELHFEHIAGQAENHTYLLLRWFASNGSTNPLDYGMIW